MTDSLHERMSELWRLPRLSQEFASGPVAELSRGKLVLRYDFETETSAYEWESIAFRGVIGLMFTDHESCREDQIAAYDKLLQIEPPSWLANLQSVRLEPAQNVRHLRIYFDEIGCYDIAAVDFEPPPASKADHDSAY